MDNRKNIENFLLAHYYPAMGIDKPSNHDKIVDFIFNDIDESADPNQWHSGDVAISFRRFIESIG